MSPYSIHELVNISLIFIFFDTHDKVRPLVKNFAIIFHKIDMCYMFTSSYHKDQPDGGGVVLTEDA